MTISGSENKQSEIEIWYTQAMIQVCDWRDKDQGFGDAIVRRVCCSLALVSLSLVGLIDAIGSLALAVLTSPGLIFGAQFPSTMGERGVKGLAACGLSLTYMQVLNIFVDTLGEVKRSPFDLDDPELL